jgi:ATP-binding cassette subfamily C protein/ATP-binding cassette subfamily C exporter for protease/lipase/ATP-binding cassette subfamily C protein EexD
VTVGIHDAPRTLKEVLRPISFALISTAAFSIGINILMLVSPLYLMQVFDRVISSAHLNTLFWLTVVAVGCVAVYGLLDIVRGRMLSKIGIWLECNVTDRLIRAGMVSARSGDKNSSQPLHDLAQVRSFLSGPAVQALFDTPWVFIFVAILWFIHPWYGVFAVVSVGVLLALAVITEIMTHKRARDAGEDHQAAVVGVESALRNAEAIHAMGMIDAVLARWRKRHSQASSRQNVLNDRIAALSGLSKFFRMAVQLAVIAIGAVLVVEGQVTGGTLIAASILLGRALAPVDQAIGSWKQITSIRSCWRRVNAALAWSAGETEHTRLPEPVGHLSVEGVMYRVPGAADALLSNITFEVRPGESMAIVGPSAAGKSLLCKLILGIATPTLGSVRIDDAEVNTWNAEDLRPHIGYLPQEISLFPGTVGENIARMSDASAEDIVAAAKLADVHQMILRLPNGYQTDVGEFGHLLSGGQRQRIGLARAVFGKPRLIVLDEPNSNLDPAGEAALVRAISELKKRGCAVVIVSHKLGIVQQLDKTLLLQNSTVQAIGPSNEVLSILMGEHRRDPAQAHPAHPPQSAPAQIHPAHRPPAPHGHVTQAAAAPNIY